MLEALNESRDLRKELMKVDEMSGNKNYEKLGTPVDSRITSVSVL
jgi:hypothetical protein